MLKIAEITEEQLKTTISFDLILETNFSKYKTSIILEIPAKDLLEQGKGVIENTNLDNIIFDKI